MGVIARVRMRTRATRYGGRATERVAKYRHWLTVEGRTKLQGRRNQGGFSSIEIQFQGFPRLIKCSSHFQQYC